MTNAPFAILNDFGGFMVWLCLDLMVIEEIHN